jgi:hypothetical protein
MMKKTWTCRIFQRIFLDKKIINANKKNLYTHSIK